MSSSTLKGLGIGCFVVCFILLFVAWERYNSNVAAVEAANRMMESSPFSQELPFGGLMKQVTGRQRLEPGVPTATTYALFFAVLSAIGGIVSLWLTATRSTRSGADRP